MVFCFYFCQVFKTVWVINQADSTSTFKFFVLIVLLCIKWRFKVKCCRYFISLEFCELIWEKCDEFFSFILNVLFYTKVMTYFSLHLLFSLNSKIWSCIFSYLYAFCNHEVLTFLSFLTFLFAIFNNNPYSTYVNFSIVSFNIIRPLQRLCDKQGFINFLTILPNCYVGVIVAVDKYVNSSIYVFSFYNFLWFKVSGL